MKPELVLRILEHDRVTASRTEEVDAVVVGSGCGGAVVAKELAGAGWSVLVLERGGLYLAERGDFDQREDDMMAKLSAGRGLDTTLDGGTAVLGGNNVGGASVHYWADSHRLPRDRCGRRVRRGRYLVTQHPRRGRLLPGQAGALRRAGALPRRRRIGAMTSWIDERFAGTAVLGGWDRPAGTRRVVRSRA